jgi:Ni,Fe-hydrogenase III large subunit
MTAGDSRYHWLAKFSERLAKAHIEPGDASTAGIATVWSLAAPEWARAAQHLRALGARLVSLWGDEQDAGPAITAAYEKHGVYLWLRSALPREEAAVGSIAASYPGAARLERHARDLLGIAITDVIDKRRWTRHQAWDEHVYPLRSDCSPDLIKSRDVPPDDGYPFDGVDGEAVCEIPVGPIHAGIIEPGHFRFHAVGETVLKLETHLGYTHKGIEKLAVGRDAAGLLRLAARVSGDSAVGHAWAAARAVEQIAGVDVPPRALLLRALLAERERIANHLGDIGAICNDVGFVFSHMQFSRLRELWLRRNGEHFGHRLLMDVIVAGGVAVNLDGQACRQQRLDIETLQRELDELEPILDNSHSLRGRTVSTGILPYESAEQLGCLGYVGRASGLTFDARIDCAYPPYDRLSLPRLLRTAGDVDARLRLRLDEIRASLALLAQLLERLQGLPAGPLQARGPIGGGAGHGHRSAGNAGSNEGFGIVEGWRGEIAATVRLRADGSVARYFPRDPSWFNWPALEVLIHGNIVPDFPVCNKSVNGSYSGHDL